MALPTALSIHQLSQGIKSLPLRQAHSRLRVAMSDSNLGVDFALLGPDVHCQIIKFLTIKGVVNVSRQALK